MQGLVWGLKLSVILSSSYMPVSEAHDSNNLGKLKLSHSQYAHQRNKFRVLKLMNPKIGPFQQAQHLGHLL